MKPTTWPGCHSSPGHFFAELHHKVFILFSPILLCVIDQRTGEWGATPLHLLLFSMAQVDEVMIHHQKDTFDYQEEYDDYINNTPLEARFDYLTIQMAIAEAFPKHKAYGMMFADYRRMRKQMQDYDDTEKKRLSFYLPSYPARIASDLAIINDIAVHTFIVYMIELGLIHFQVDYHDEYEIVKNSRQKIFNAVKSEESKNRYMQLDKQTITLGSGSGVRTKLAKHYTPNVPEWLHNAIGEVGNHMNTTNSDLIYFTFCYGLINCIESSQIPELILTDMNKVCKEFDYELRQYSSRIRDLISQVDNGCTTTLQTP